MRYFLFLPEPCRRPVWSYPCASLTAHDGGAKPAGPAPAPARSVLCDDREVLERVASPGSVGQTLVDAGWMTQIKP